MGALASIFVLPKNVGEWGRLILLVLVLAPSCFLLGQCDGKRIERRVWEVKAARIQAAAEKMQRAADTIRLQAEAAAKQQISNERREIDDATRSIPDQSLSARQRARVCIELRRQGATARELESACGPTRTP